MQTITSARSAILRLGDPACGDPPYRTAERKEPSALRPRLTYRNPSKRHPLSNGGMTAVRIDFEDRASRLEVGREREASASWSGCVEASRAHTSLSSTIGLYKRPCRSLLTQVRLRPP